MSLHFLSHTWDVQDLPDGTRVLLTPRDLEANALANLVDELYDLTVELGPPTLYLDLHAVRQLASVVAGKLLALDRRLRQVDGRLVLCRPVPAVYEALQAARLTDVLEVRAEAVP